MDEARGDTPRHHPIEIRPPDIGRWRQGNTGVDFVHEFDSGRSGPTVMVQALTHGNEFCGALALDWLLDRGPRPVAGRLIVARSITSSPSAPGQSQRTSSCFSIKL